VDCVKNEVFTTLSETTPEHLDVDEPRVSTEFQRRRVREIQQKFRKEVFLEEVDQIIPRQEMSEVVKPHHRLRWMPAGVPSGSSVCYAFNFPTLV